ncbi:MAG: hypothetical protein ACRDV2_01655 [Actinomycetes bacterium]
MNVNAQRAVLSMSAPVSAVRHVLLRPLAFPDWNPAFRTLTGPPAATLGVGYPMTVRPGLSGEFWYAAITGNHIETRREVPAMAEVGTWDLYQQGARTLVTHAFEHSGPLAKLLSGAFRGVAEVRLTRLADRAGALPVTARRAAADGDTIGS